MSKVMTTDYVQLEHGKSGLMPRIPALYAFLGVDKDGDEGVAAFFNPATALAPAGWIPMVAADEKRLDGLREIAQGMAKTGAVLRLVKFTMREDVETIL